METTMLKTLYRNLGSDYSNFSIGRFQIKPLFAEEIRTMATSLPDRRNRNIFRLPADFQNEKLYRADIIASLENPRSEILYLILYIKLFRLKYSDFHKGGRESIALLATGYNAGLGRSYDDLVKLRSAKYFTTKIAGGEKYCYADISIEWYRQQMARRASFELVK
jgi:hypothetical protein